MLLMPWLIQKCRLHVGNRLKADQLTVIADKCMDLFSVIHTGEWQFLRLYLSFEYGLTVSYSVSVYASMCSTQAEGEWTSMNETECDGG